MQELFLFAATTPLRPIPNPAYHNPKISNVEIEFHFAKGCFMNAENKTRPNPKWFTPPHLKRKVSAGQYGRALKKYQRARWTYLLHCNEGNARRARYWGGVCQKWIKIMDAFSYQRELASRIRYVKSIPRVFFQNPFCIHGISMEESCAACAP